MQGTINQRYVHCNVLPELSERNCSIGDDEWIVPGDTQCPSCELDALLSGRLQIVRPTRCVEIGMTTGGHRKRRPVIRVPLQCQLGQLKRTPGPFSTHKIKSSARLQEKVVCSEVIGRALDGAAMFRHL